MTCSDRQDALPGSGGHSKSVNSRSRTTRVPNFPVFSLFIRSSAGLASIWQRSFFFFFFCVDFCLTEICQPDAIATTTTTLLRFRYEPRPVCSSLTMDVALELLDPLILDKAYAWALPHPGVAGGFGADASNNSYAANASFSGAVPTSQWPRDNIYRQIISILAITQFGATSLYLVMSALSYYFIFDRRLEYHPRFLKNQVSMEIKSSLSAVPVINILTLPWFLGEVRGKSLLYSDVAEYGWSWVLISTVLYMAFNDIGIYWIHRLEHHPSVYKYIHKPHHKWIGSSSLVLHLQSSS